MKILIKVTQNDIDQGLRAHVDCCPIALALQRELDSDLCTVHPKKYASDGYIRYQNIQTELPFEANAFANEFDKGEFVEPFEFEIEI